MSRAGQGVARGLTASLALIALAACSEADQRGGAAAEPPPATTRAEAVRARATDLLTALRDGDSARIAAFIHPTKGVRLSPYAFVDRAEDEVLTAAEFPAVWSSDSRRVWGVEDATGEPLMMSCADYFARFVYDTDFLQAEQVAVGNTIGRGNTIDNALAAYPEGTLVEYHFSGFDPRYGGLDWKSLRLVFEQFEGDWYVVGIIHDGWTS